ncbi:MAG: hypothetical protein KME09_04575 [Pleurocapsa minor HA4230-MV1]|jgi:hypothetical protein|nr:hypothetical protein [Pleurocapsa minor HA4230-MV1]
MNNVNLLRNTLKSHLKWHGARLSFLALFLIALFRVKTVNLVDLSIGFKSKAKKESNYKRLQRFLRDFDLDYYDMAKLVIEDTHLVDSERLSRLFALLTIALCWAYRTGEWLSDQKPILIKTHGRKAQSIFRYGFDYLRHVLLNLDEHQADFRQSLQFLSCT